MTERPAADGAQMTGSAHVSLRDAERGGHEVPEETDVTAWPDSG